MAPGAVAIVVLALLSLGIAYAMLVAATTRGWWRRSLLALGAAAAVYCTLIVVGWASNPG